MSEISQEQFNTLKKSWSSLKNDEKYSNVFKTLDSDKQNCIEKIILSCDYDQFLDFVNNEQIPALKLTKNEMELLHGGGGWLEDLINDVKSLLRAFDSFQI